MARWTEDQFDAWKEQQRQAWEAGGPGDIPDPPDVGRPAPIIPASRMNKTEAKFAEYLEQLKHLHEIIDWRYEPCRWILAHNVKGARNATAYCPDFLVVYPECFTFYEIKAKSGDWTSQRDDSLVKQKVVAEMYPWFRFVRALYEKGEWIFEEV
jgi:hypothetical protein